MGKTPEFHSGDSGSRPAWRFVSLSPACVSRLLRRLFPVVFLLFPPSTACVSRLLRRPFPVVFLRKRDGNSGDQARLHETLKETFNVK